MKKFGVFTVLCIAIGLFICGCDEKEPEAAPAASEVSVQPEDIKMEYKVEKTPQEWKEILTDEQYRILRKKGTERAFTGQYHDSKEEGTYTCAGCGQELFSSETKFDSGTGWPSYYAPYEDGHIEEKPDNSLFMKRTEVLCSRCGGHLGHVFNDGPRPTGLRYCINSAALDFEPAEEEKPE